MIDFAGLGSTYKKTCILRKTYLLKYWSCRPSVSLVSPSVLQPVSPSVRPSVSQSVCQSVLLSSYYYSQISPLQAGYPLTLPVKLPLDLSGHVKSSTGLGLAELPCIVLDTSRLVPTSVLVC